MSLNVLTCAIALSVSRVEPVYEDTVTLTCDLGSYSSIWTNNSEENGTIAEGPAVGVSVQQGHIIETGQAGTATLKWSRTLTNTETQVSYVTTYNYALSGNTAIKFSEIIPGTEPKHAIDLLHGSVTVTGVINEPPAMVPTTTTAPPRRLIMTRKGRTSIIPRGTVFYITYNHPFVDVRMDSGKLEMWSGAKYKISELTDTLFRLNLNADEILEETIGVPPQ